MIKAVSPLREQLLTGQIAWRVDLLVVIAILCLHCVRGQQDGCLWRTIDVVIQDGLLHLQEEQPLCGVLDQLLRHVLGVELGAELKQKWAFLPHILGCHLKESRGRCERGQLGHLTANWQLSDPPFCSA